MRETIRQADNKQRGGMHSDERKERQEREKEVNEVTSKYGRERV